MIINKGQISNAVSFVCCIKKYQFTIKTFPDTLMICIFEFRFSEQ